VQTDSYFAERYRKAVASGDLVAGLFGLGECGSASDLDVIEQYLEHDRPTIASAALDCTCRLSESERTDLLLEFLKHNYPRCSRTAAYWLSKSQNPAVHQACIENLNNGALPFHVRRNSLSISLRQGKWTSLEAILTALGQSQSKLSLHAEAALSRWLRDFNRSFVQPTTGQKKRIREALEGGSLDNRQRRKLSSTLDWYQLQPT
jgi:hypothetical protein